MEEKQRREDAHWQKIRDEGKMSTKNKSKMAYDILTLQYQQNTDGEHQKYLDDMGKLVRLYLSCHACKMYFFE